MTSPDDNRREIDEELRAHVEARTAHLVRLGMSEEDARKAALARFRGGLDQTGARLSVQATRAARRQRVTEYVRQWLGDMRLVGRGFRRQPLFAIGVVAILALGFGVNTAVFRVTYDLLYRAPAGVQDAGRLRRLDTWMTFGGGTPQRATAFSYTDAAHIVNSGALPDAALYLTPRHVTLADGREATVTEVDSRFLPMMGVSLAAGRHFSADEAQPGAGVPVAMVSATMWDRLFGVALPSSGGIDASLTLADRTYRVVGVLAPGFRGIDLDPVDVWLPIGMASRGRSAVNGVEIPWYQSAMARAVRIVGRIPVGANDDTINARVTAVLAAADRELNLPLRQSDLRPLVPVGDASQVGQARDLVRRLLLVAVLVLIIAAANVANLLLAHGLHRQQEVAVRLSLGAGRSRVVRLLVLQSVCLSMAGGLAALMAGTWTAHALWRVLLPGARGELAWIDPVTLGATLAMALMVGLVTGIPPAWQATKPDVMAALRAGWRLGHRRSRLTRNTLIVGQTALSTTLLVLAGLLVVSLLKLGRAPLGFNPEGLVTVSVSAFRLDQSADHESETVDVLVAGLPPAAVARATVAPFGATYARDISVPGTTFEPESPFDGAKAAEVSPNYFSVMGTRLIEGRGFLESDTMGADPVVIVNATMKRNYWGKEIPPGACIMVGICARVIGVVEDIHDAPGGAIPMRYYLPLAQTTRPANVAIIRMPPEATDAVVSQVRAASPDGLRVSIDVVAERMSRAVRPWRTAAGLFLVLGLLGLTLAAVGIYSVVNFFAAERLPEFGMRMVLGADPTNVLLLVLRDGLGLLAVGGLVGLVGAALVGQSLGALLFDVSPFHPLVYLASLVTLAVAATVAMWSPARRAARVNPVVALRGE